jgi:hypothetical protein
MKTKGAKFPFGDEGVARSDGVAEFRAKKSQIYPTFMPLAGLFIA